MRVIKLGFFWHGESIFDGFRTLRGLLEVLICINPATNHQKKLQKAVSPPEGVQRRVMGQNMGFWAKRVHF